MTINEKIFLFLKENEIEELDFYKSINLNRQQWYLIVNDKSNFTIDMIKRIKKKYSSLDLNKLLDDEQESFTMVMEDRAEYNNTPLQKDLRKAISLLEKHTK